MKILQKIFKWSDQFTFHFMIIFLYFILTLIFSTCNYSQSLKEKKDWFENGEFFYNSEDYTEAVFYYLKLHEADPENGNINYHIGSCYLNIAGQERKSIIYFEQALPQIDEKYNATNFKSTFEQKKCPLHTYFFLAQAYRMADQMDKALDMLDKFSNSIYFEGKYNESIVTAEFEACKKAQIIMERPVVVSFSNLGPAINNSNENYNPVLSQDSSVIIYMTNLKFYNAIFMSRKVKGAWQAAEEITPQVGSDGDSYPCFLGPDGKTLFLVKKIKKNSHIYSSHFVHDKWTIMEPLNENVNSKWSETHASLSADGKKLYFASNRKGSIGGFDIWYSELQADGQWGKAVNVGPAINTKLDEDNPFETNNGNVLFFVSQGHLNMGGFDIFYSKKHGNQWSAAINLGYPVNTTTDDKFYFPIGNGTTAYMARRMSKGYGLQDIYRVSITGGDPMKDLYPDYKNEEMLLAQKNTPEKQAGQKDVTMREQQNKADQPAEYTDKLSSDTSLTKNEANITPVPLGNEKPAVEAKLDEKQVLVNDVDSQLISLNIDTSAQMGRIVEQLKSLEKSNPYIIREKPAEKIGDINDNTIIRQHVTAIFFSFNSFKILSESINQLEVLAEALFKCKDVEIEIRGYADALGTDAINNTLSQKRAETVVNYLISKGIQSKRLNSRFFGKENPVAINTNPDGSDNPGGRKFNRRVDFDIISPSTSCLIIDPVQIPAELRVK